MFFLEIGNGGVTAGERVTWTENRCKIDDLRVTGVKMAGFYDGTIRIHDGTIEISPFIVPWRPSGPPSESGEGI